MHEIYMQSIDESYFLFSLGYDTVEDDLQGECMCHNLIFYDQISSAASGQLAPIDSSYEVVGAVDTPSDGTDPDTFINEWSFSQASPVEHHPTACDEDTCTTYTTNLHTEQTNIYNR